MHFGSGTLFKKGFSSNRNSFGIYKWKFKITPYQLVCNGITGHTEACKIEFDQEITNLFILLEHYFFIIDPTSLN